MVFRMAICVRLWGGGRVSIQEMGVADQVNLKYKVGISGPRFGLGSQKPTFSGRISRKTGSPPFANRKKMESCRLHRLIYIYKKPILS